MELVVQSQNQNNPTAKRPDLIQGQNPELPAKRPKLDEPMEVPKEEEEEEEEEEEDDDLVYCVICKKNVIDHTFFTCPNKAKAYGMFCFICESPSCKRSDNEHINDQEEVLKDCLECGVIASHWEDECPYINKESHATGVDVDPEIDALFY